MAVALARRRLDRHEVLHLADPVGVEQARDQDVRVGEVELLRPRAGVRGRDAVAAAAVGVEDRGEDARRVEARAAVPVDRAVGGDERDGVQVADDAVLLDRRVPLAACSRRAYAASPSRSPERSIVARSPASVYVGAVDVRYRPRSPRRRRPSRRARDVRADAPSVEPEHVEEVWDAELVGELAAARLARRPARLDVPPGGLRHAARRASTSTRSGVRAAPAPRASAWPQRPAAVAAVGASAASAGRPAVRDALRRHRRRHAGDRPGRLPAASTCRAPIRPARRPIEASGHLLQTLSSAKPASLTRHDRRPTPPVSGIVNVAVASDRTGVDTVHWAAVNADGRRATGHRASTTSAARRAAARSPITCRSG